MARYPWRGLGLSSNLNAADEPHPYRLLEASPGAFDFVEYSAPLSLVEARRSASLFGELWERRLEIPALFHPVHLNLYGPELEPEESLAELRDHARAIGSAWVGNDLGWWHSGGTPFPGYLYVAPPLEVAGVRDCAAHARHVQRGLGEIPLLIENPALISLSGEMHLLEFMRQVHLESGCDLLIDLGHLWSHQLSRGLPLVESSFDSFPWDRVVEVHIAGGVVTRRGGRAFYVDDHTQPVREELFTLLGEVLPRCTGLKALTYEGDGHPREIARQVLERLRPVVPKRPIEQGFVAAEEVGAAHEAWTAASRPWELFNAVHGRAKGADVEGLEAELDFRAAVIAEQLDARWPLSRLLLAGTKDRLRAFVASDEYEEVFSSPGRDLDAAFARWSRRECLRAGGAAMAVVAFETWTQSLHRHPTPKPADGYTLSPDVFAATFPTDLSELFFAAKALRRHLTGRGWASGVVELSALESLAQVAARAAQRPWNVVVRKGPVRTEIVPLPPGAHALVSALASGEVVVPLAPGPQWTAADIDAVIRAGLLHTSAAD